jgi:hypothetical protein
MTLLCNILEITKIVGMRTDQWLPGARDKEIDRGALKEGGYL